MPKLVLQVAKSTDFILDYGAGKHAIHALDLQSKGLRVTAYEIGDNVTDLHTISALDWAYDIVYASNVLNVLPSWDVIISVCDEIYKICDRVFICNYPKSPRKSDVTLAEIEEILKSRFSLVTRDKFVFVCTK